MLLVCSGFVCYGPQGGWHLDTPVYRTGGCFLCGLHSSVVRFPRLLAAGTTRRSDSRTVHRVAFFGLAIPTRLAAGNDGASQLPDSSLVPCHALGPRQALDSLTLTAVLSRLPTTLTGSPPAFNFVTRLDCFRETRPPLRPGTFPVHASTMAFASAPCNFSRVVLLPYIIAGLGTSDRLHLTRRGLAPRKKSQTCAGAHQGRTASCLTAPSQIPACSFSAPGSSELFASALVRVIISNYPLVFSVMQGFGTAYCLNRSASPAQV